MFVRERNVDLARYRPLLRAVTEKNVEATDDFIKKNCDDLLKAQINEYGETIFHLIVKESCMNGLTAELVSRDVSPEFLELKDVFDRTALHIAAAFGNTKAVELLVNKNRELLTTTDCNGDLPVQLAVLSEDSKDTVECLLSFPETKVDKYPSECADVLRGLIQVNHIGIALEFLNKNKQLADRHFNPYWKETVNVLARKELGSQLSRGIGWLGSFHSFIYHYIPIEKWISKSVDGDIEQQNQISRETNMFGNLQYFLWQALMLLVPGVKRTQEEKLLHIQTLEIVRLMLGKDDWKGAEAMESLKKPLFTAAKLGNDQFVKEIFKVYVYPDLLYNKHGQNIFHLAVLHRQEKVFNLIYNTPRMVLDAMAMDTDDYDNNLLHLTGKLVPSSTVPGAALQMQRELQWFKAIKDTFHPSIERKRNLYKKKPREYFTENHKELVKEGEKWMKDTATSCSLVAALIITAIFATVYTFPGGINNEGIPNFLHKTSYKVFLVSIALAFFSSTASVQMFLGILTSRYAEEDFLKALPKKLIIGLITLFFSIASMMVAFGSTFHILLHQPWKWVTLLMCVFGSVPVILFAWTQFPLFVDIVKSTYFHTILKPNKKKKDRYFCLAGLCLCL